MKNNIISPGKQPLRSVKKSKCDDLEKKVDQSLLKTYTMSVDYLGGFECVAIFQQKVGVISHYKNKPIQIY